LSGIVVWAVNGGADAKGVDPINALAEGWLVGTIPAAIIDAAALAWTTEPVRSEPGRAEHAGLDWRVFTAPTPMRDGMVAGVSGRM
jgi:hypothetical protein